MVSSSEDELPLAQSTVVKKDIKPKPEEVNVPKVQTGETAPMKAKVGPSANGNGAVKEEGMEREGDSPADTKPPPDKKRKKSAENGAKGKEAARRSKKEKIEPKMEEKKPAVDTKEKSDTTKPAKGTKPKVKYDIPGQTQPTPNPGEPLAKFYMSLREQRPKSEIASKWCVQRGLLSREEAEAWLKENGKASTAKDTAKAPSKPRAPAAKKPAAKKPVAAPKKGGEKPARTSAARKKKDIVFESDDNEEDSASEEEEDGDESEEVLPSKSKRTSNKSTASRASAPSKAKAASNGKAHKKRKRKNDSESDGENGNDVDVPVAPKKKDKRSSAVAASPAMIGESDDQVPTIGKQAQVADDESSDDDMPLAQRRKVAA